MTQTAQTNRLTAHEAAFAANMQALNLETANRFITALSGGPDSTALACLADRYARSRGKDHQAVIVNHNIRPDAANEALRVRQRMQKRGIASQILTIKNKAPATAVQEWARHERFAALTKLARQQGAVLLVAHHQSDQAETVLMRLSRGSGVVGLAGMRALTQRDAVWVARPLLDWSADSLMDVLGLFDCAYEDDPSNQNTQFERVQMRQFLRDGGACGETLATGALRLRRTMLALSNHLDAASSTIWHAATPLFATGHAVMDMGKLSDLPQTAWVYRVRQLIRQIGGRPYGASDQALTGLHQRLLAGQNSTLGGCQFVQSGQHGKARRFYVVRELGRTPEMVDVAAGDDIIFAGCWRVRTNQDGRLVHAGALAKSHDANASTIWPPAIAALPYIVRRAIPVISTLDGRVFYPQLKGVNPAVTSIDTALSAQFLGR